MEVGKEEGKTESDSANSFNAPPAPMCQTGQSRFNQEVNEFKCTPESAVKTARNSKKWRGKHQCRRNLEWECLVHLAIHSKDIWPFSQHRGGGTLDFHNERNGELVYFSPLPALYSLQSVVKSLVVSVNGMESTQPTYLAEKGYTERSRVSWNL